MGNRVTQSQAAQMLKELSSTVLHTWGQEGLYLCLLSSPQLQGEQQARCFQWHRGGGCNDLSVGGERPQALQTCL